MEKISFSWMSGVQLMKVWAISKYVPKEELAFREISPQTSKFLLIKTETISLF